jgi:tripartite-type tricarboxylate transporter receptor subunit TctC
MSHHVLHRSIRRCIGLLALSLLAVTTTVFPGAVRAAGEPFPTKSVTLLVPYAAGGGMDAMARAIAPYLQAQWGQTVIVENIGGAQSLLGTSRVINGPRDGHQLLVQNPALLTLSRLYKGIDPMASLQPASLMASIPILLAVHPSVPARDMKQLFEHCKNKSGQPCSFGAGETVGSALNRRLAAEARIDNASQVPYRGTAPLVNDLRGGHLTAGFASVASALQHHRAGGLRIIGVATEAGRVPQLPDVATFQEQGLKDIFPTWVALFLPAGAPKAVAERIDVAVRKALADEELRKTLDRLGAIPSTLPRADFARSLPKEQKIYEDLLDRFPIQQ